MQGLHSTRGSPQKLSSHWSHCRPPKPGLQSHWPVKRLHSSLVEPEQEGVERNYQQLAVGFSPTGSQAQNSQPSPLAIFQWFTSHSEQKSPTTLGRQLHFPETLSQASLDRQWSVISPH